MQFIFLRATLLENKIFMSDLNKIKKVFISKFFKIEKEDVVCLCDINYISDAKTPRFDIKKITNSE